MDEYKQWQVSEKRITKDDVEPIGLEYITKGLDAELDKATITFKVIAARIKALPHKVDNRVYLVSRFTTFYVAILKQLCSFKWC